MLEIVPTLEDLENQVVSAIKAKNDFTHSCLPSSLKHYGYWALAGASATGSAVITGAALVLGYKFGEEIYQSTAHGKNSPVSVPFEVLMGAVMVAMPLVPASCLAMASGHSRQWIADDNAAILENMERGIADACQRLAEAARHSSPVNFENLLKRETVPLPSLIAACSEDADKASLLADHLLTTRQLSLLPRLADHGLQQCSAVGDVLLNALRAPQAFVEMLEEHPDDAADVLAVLCIARNAMAVSTPTELEAYLQDHSEVAREALTRLKARILDLDMPEMLEQITKMRTAGVVMTIALQGATDMPLV